MRTSETSIGLYDSQGVAIIQYDAYESTGIRYLNVAGWGSAVKKWSIQPGLCIQGTYIICEEDICRTELADPFCVKSGITWLFCKCGINCIASAILLLIWNSQYKSIILQVLLINGTFLHFMVLENVAC